MLKFTTIAGVVSATSIVAAQVSDVPVSIDGTAMLKYGATQGGLLLVVLAMMYIYRKDLIQKIDLVHTDRQILMTLVQDVTAALTKNIDAVEAQRKATERLADAFTSLASRRHSD